MIPGAGKNPLDLTLRAPKVRPTLEAMRLKLASASNGRSSAIQSPALPGAAHRRKAPGLQSLAAIGLFTAALLGMHFLLRSHREEILEAVGIRTLTSPLAPPAGLSLDDRARFWAYAAFDAHGLRERFPVPASALIDPVDAQHHLADILEQEVGPAARAEALGLRQRAANGAAP
jgi:hypothetical protein